jgi:hypothetical protein
MESITNGAHVNWANEEISKKLPLTMLSFVKEFDYFDQADADSAFVQLLSSTNIPKGYRDAAMSSYVKWKRNNGNAFWADRVALSMTKISKKQTAGELVAGSVPVAKKLIQEDDENSSNENPAHNLPQGKTPIVL